MKKLMTMIFLVSMVLGFAMTATAATTTKKPTPTPTKTRTKNPTPTPTPTPTPSPTPSPTPTPTPTKTSEKTTIYLDTLSGNYNENEDMQTTSAKFDGKLSGTIFGLESPVNNRFKFGLEYGQVSVNDINSTASGSWKYYALKDYDLTLFEAKGGYRVVDYDSFKLDVIMSVLNINYETEYVFNSSGNILTQRSNMSGNMLGADLVYHFSEKAALQCTVASSLLGASVSNFQNRQAEDEAAINEYKIKFNYFVTDNWALTLGYRYYQFSGKTIYSTVDDKMDGTLSGTSIGVKLMF